MRDRNSNWGRGAFHTKVLIMKSIFETQLRHKLYLLPRKYVSVSFAGHSVPGSQLILMGLDPEKETLLALSTLGSFYLFSHSVQVGNVNTHFISMSRRYSLKPDNFP